MLLKVNDCFAASAVLTASMLVGIAAGNESGCVSSYHKNKDYFPDKIRVKYGAGFTIKYTTNAKYISNTISDETYVLYQCGTPAPADADPTPSNSLQVGGWRKLFAVPGSHIVLSSAPASAALELLGAQSAVAASYKYFQISSSCMQKRLAGLPHVDRSYDAPRVGNTGQKRHGLLSKRVWYHLNSTLTTYGLSDPRSIAINPEDASDMLGKAEWIKFVGALLNKEAEANRVFDRIEARYKCIKAKALSAGGNARGRTVGFARYNRTPNGTILSWTVDEFPPWFLQGLADAGLNGYRGYTQPYRTVDQFYTAIKDWHILLDNSTQSLPHGGAKIPEWNDLVNGYRFSDKTRKLPFYHGNSIYRTDLISGTNNATDYDEHLQVLPDVLLADFVKLGLASNGTKSATWHRNMPMEEPINWHSAKQCTDVNARLALPPTGVDGCA